MDPENSVLQILKSQTYQKNLDPWETCSVYILKLGNKFYLFAQNNNTNIEKELFEVRANLLTLQSTTNNPYSQKTIDSHPSLDRKIFGTTFCKFFRMEFWLGICRPFEGFEKLAKFIAEIFRNVVNSTRPWS
jgi:hypothetical protein